MTKKTELRQQILDPASPLAVHRHFRQPSKAQCKMSNTARATMPPEGTVAGSDVEGNAVHAAAVLAAAKDGAPVESQRESVDRQQPASRSAGDTSAAAAEEPLDNQDSVAHKDAPDEDLAPPSKKKARTATTRIRRVGLVAVTQSKEPPVEAGSPSVPFKMHSKHDAKWNAMFEKLRVYNSQFKNTLVPQCYDQDPRLGRWVHYQRGTSVSVEDAG